VVVSYSNSGAACEVALGESWRVRPDTRLLTDLGSWLAPENVQVLYAATG
jgi:DNA polymerase III subunit alpha